MPPFFKNLFLLIFIFLSACSGGNDKQVVEKKTTATETAVPGKDAKETGNSISEFGYFTPDGDSLIIPPFEIEVHLSPKAKAKLSKGNETIIVSASFTGIPKDTASGDYRNPGETGIAGRDIELRNDEVARFGNLKFSKSLFESLSDKDIQLLINVFSGRHSSTDNLLNCGIIQEKMSRIKGKKFVVDCKLIYGEQ